MAQVSPPSPLANMAGFFPDIPLANDDDAKFMAFLNEPLPLQADSAGKPGSRSLPKLSVSAFQSLLALRRSRTQMQKKGTYPACLQKNMRSRLPAKSESRARPLRVFAFKCARV